MIEPDSSGDFGATEFSMNNGHYKKKTFYSCLQQSTKAKSWKNIISLRE